MKVLGVDIALVVNAATTSPDGDQGGYGYSDSPWYTSMAISGLHLNLATVHP